MAHIQVWLFGIFLFFSILTLCIASFGCADYIAENPNEGGVMLVLCGLLVILPYLLLFCETMSIFT